MSAQPFDRDTFECLQSIGFISHDGTTLLTPSGEAISSHNVIRLETIGGRASNLRYMRRAMDRYDGVDAPASGTPQGDQQFDHLIKHWPVTALIYFALRRLQRDGEFSRLRTGLALLISYERQEITADDILAALWPNGQAQATQKLLLPQSPIPIEG